MKHLFHSASVVRPQRLFAATLALALAGGLTFAAVAAPHGGAMGLGSSSHVQKMLDAVNATPEQRAQIKTIVDAAQADMKADRSADRGLREQGLQLFGQPTVDARAVESLRQQMLARHDQSSRRAAQAMIDVSRVLTVDQRKQLVEQMAQRRASFDRRQGSRDQASR